MDVGILLLSVGAVLAGSVLVALGASRVGVPSLVVFLGLGMLLGSDGPGGIDFSDAAVARTVGVVGLAAILYEGGLSSSWRRLRSVAGPAALLATVGVLATALLTAPAAHLLFDLPWRQSVLLGAVVASTDAAAVFATLRYTDIRRRLARTLEAETGLNDPVAIALTLGLIAWIERPDAGVSHLVLEIGRQLGLGLVVGAVFAVVAAWMFARIPPSIGAFTPVASVAVAALSFGAADVIGGSGFLAVYLVGLAVGSTPTRYRSQIVAFHQGLAFLAQVTLFVVLGLLVFPHRLVGVAAAGLALALLLVVVVRPLAVWVSTALNRFTAGERVLLGWAGLRGAAPIVLATFALSAGINKAETIFNAVFFRRGGLDPAPGHHPGTPRPAPPAGRPAAQGRRRSARGGRPRTARAGRVRCGRRPCRRPRHGQRAGPTPARPHRPDRPGSRHHPATRVHRDPPGRPTLRAQPSSPGSRARRHLRSLAPAGLSIKKKKEP